MAATVAVTTAVPSPTSVTSPVSASTVATPSFEIEYVIAPLLLAVATGESKGIPKAAWYVVRGNDISASRRDPSALYFTELT